MPPRPRTADEVALEQTQRQVTQGLLADTARKEVMMRLWVGGMTQKEIAERLSRASLAAGGRAISENAVYKLISHVKQAEDDAA